jgi:hypothetical protein
MERFSPPPPPLVLERPKDPTVAGDVPRTGVNSGARLSPAGARGGLGPPPDLLLLNSSRLDRADALGRREDSAMLLADWATEDDGVCRGVAGVREGTFGGAAGAGGTGGGYSRPMGPAGPPGTLNVLGGDRNVCSRGKPSPSAGERQSTTGSDARGAAATVGPTTALAPRVAKGKPPTCPPTARGCAGSSAATWEGPPSYTLPPTSPPSPTVSTSTVWPSSPWSSMPGCIVSAQRVETATATATPTPPPAPATTVQASTPAPTPLPTTATSRGRLPEGDAPSGTVNIPPRPPVAARVGLPTPTPALPLPPVARAPALPAGAREPSISGGSIKSRNPWLPVPSGLGRYGGNARAGVGGTEGTEGGGAFHPSACLSRTADNGAKGHLKSSSTTRFARRRLRPKSRESC